MPKMKCTCRFLFLSTVIIILLIIISNMAEISMVFGTSPTSELKNSLIINHPHSLNVSSMDTKRSYMRRSWSTLQGNTRNITKLMSNLVKGRDLVVRSSSEPTKPIQRMVIAVVCCGNRINETKIMLKSAAALSQAKLKFIIFTEDNMKPVFKNVLSSWPTSIQNRISLELHSITFPPGQDANIWKKLFKPCAAQRLFIPSLLVNEDALLYVDTDVVFLSPVEEVWQHFQAMNSSHMAAVAPESEDLATGWYNRFAKHPYYGRLGVNSGVMLMNLTRLRHFGWEEYVVPIYQHYRLAIRWGDQDIINIIFHFHSDKLYIFGCEYNFRSDHCMYMSVCSSAEKRGIFVLHGSRDTFHNKKQPAFRAVHQAWNEYELGEDLRQNLYYPMQRYLLKTTSTNCGKLHNIYLKIIGSLIQLR